MEENGRKPSSLPSSAQMEHHLTGKWLILNACCLGIFALFVTGPPAIFNVSTTLKQELIQQDGLYSNLALVYTMLPLQFIALGIVFAMRRKQSLRHNYPWNLILTLAFYLLYGLSFSCMSLLYMKYQLRSEIISNFIGAGFPAAWFSSFWLVYLVIFWRFQCSGGGGFKLDSRSTILLGILIFLASFVSFYLFIDFILIGWSQNQPKCSYWIMLGVFCVLGVLCHLLSLKMGARRLRKYLHKLEEQKENESDGTNIYDFIFGRPWRNC